MAPGPIERLNPHADHPILERMAHCQQEVFRLRWTRVLAYVAVNVAAASVVVACGQPVATSRTPPPVPARPVPVGYRFRLEPECQVAYLVLRHPGGRLSEQRLACGKYFPVREPADDRDFDPQMYIDSSLATPALPGTDAPYALLHPVGPKPKDSDPGAGQLEFWGLRGRRALTTSPIDIATAALYYRRYILYVTVSGGGAAFGLVDTDTGRHFSSGLAPWMPEFHARQLVFSATSAGPGNGNALYCFDLPTFRSHTLVPELDEAQAGGDVHWTRDGRIRLAWTTAAGKKTTRFWRCPGSRHSR